MRVGACSTTGIKTYMKTVVLWTPHVVHSKSMYKSQTSLDNRLAFLLLGLHVIGTCVYKTELTSGFRKWGHLPTFGLSMTVYHCVMKTTKLQLTYKLFQNIVIP